MPSVNAGIVTFLPCRGSGEDGRYDPGAIHVVVKESPGAEGLEGGPDDGDPRTVLRGVPAGMETVACPDAGREAEEGLVPDAVGGRDVIAGAAPVSGLGCRSPWARRAGSG